MIVEVETVCRLLETGDGPANGRVDTTLRYDPTDPYAVTVVFREGEQEVVWTFARSLLADGCNGHAGDLDVQVWPGPPGIFLRLSSPEGRCLFVIPRKDVVKFVRRSYALVARGRESEHVNVDAALARLLAGA